MKRKALLSLYRKALKPQFMRHLTSPPAAHVTWMLEQMATQTDEAKFNRWLGFVQGYLWCNGLYTIEEMREHVKTYLVAKKK